LLRAKQDAQAGRGKKPPRPLAFALGQYPLSMGSFTVFIERSWLPLFRTPIGGLGSWGHISPFDTHCRLTLRVIGQRYGGISDSAVNKVVSRFRTRLSKDKKLNVKIKKIVSNGEM